MRRPPKKGPDTFYLTFASDMRSASGRGPKGHEEQLLLPTARYRGRTQKGLLTPSPLTRNPEMTS